MDGSKITAARQAKAGAAVLQLRIIDLAGGTLDGLRERDALLLAYQAVEIARDAISEHERDITDGLLSDIEEDGCLTT